MQDVDVDTLRLMLDYLYLGSLLDGLFILFSQNLLIQERFEILWKN